MWSFYKYILLLFITVSFYAQTARVSLPLVGSAGGELTVPVVAKNLGGVGAVTLKIFIEAGLTYTGYEKINEKLSGSFQNFNDNYFLLSWDNFAGVDLLADTLIYLKLYYTGGTPALKFSDDCEIADTLGNVMNVEFVDGGVSGISNNKEKTGDAGFSLYPNPGKNKVIFSFGNNIIQGELKIFSVTGEMILKKFIDEDTGSFRFDLSMISNGVYFYMFLPTGKTKFQKGFSGKFLVAK